MDSHSRRPPLSILVPNSSSIRPDLPSPAKQKRLFPIACRVVPTDQWFTTRIDRTWSVKDLKVWLLSKALPPHVLPLPPSYRPSSPVTFAAAPPTATEATPATPYSSTTPSPGDDTAILETTDDVQEPSSDPNANSRPRLPISHSAPAPAPVPLSIPYSYNTGAPAISGIEALKNRHPGPTGDSELVQNMLQIADRWSLHSFSMGGMLLTDASPLSEYSLNPHELLELHRAGAYAPLPKSAQPSLPNPMSFPVDIGYTRTASARAAGSTPRPKPEKPSTKSKSKPKNRQHALKSEANIITPSSSPLHGYTHHGQLSSSTSSECESDQDAEDFEEIYGSPYAQPYFDGWALVLRIRGLSSSGKKGADKSKGREEEDGVSRCEAADPPGLGSSSSGTESWKKMWIIIRESRIGIRRQREYDEEGSWFIGSCVGLYGIDKLKYLLGHDPPQTNPVRQHHRPQTSTHQHHTPSEPLPYRVSTNSSRKSVQPGKDLTICAKFTEDSGGSRWLFLRTLDPQSHEHLLRIIHRLAYTSPLRLHSIYPNPLRHSATQSISQSLSQSVDFPPLSPLTHPHFRPTTHTMRTLRTEFLPNPIPHPLALSFSAPSPLTGQDDVSDEDLPLFGSGRRRSLFDAAEFASGDELLGDDDLTFNNSHHHHHHHHHHASVSVSAASSFGPSSSYGMGLGTGMGVRFPEWREEVLIRAVNAGLTGGLGMGGLDRREYVSHDRRHLLGKLGDNGGGDGDGDGGDDNNNDGSNSNSRHDIRANVVQSQPQPPSRTTSRTSSLSGTAVDSVDQAALGVLDDTESDSDSEAGSEKEWEGWAYDLDRLKGVKYPKARGVGGGAAGAGASGGSDEDREHYNHHYDTTTSNEKRFRRTTQGRRDRARTIVGASVVGVTPTPMPTPTVASSSPLGAGMDLFSSLAAFRIQQHPPKQQQQQQQQQQSTSSIPLSPTKVGSSTTLSTLSSNSTITLDRDVKSRRGSQREGGGGGDSGEGGILEQQAGSSKPSSPATTTSTRMSPLTRARSATVSAVSAAVRSTPASSSSNVQPRQPQPQPFAPSKPKPKPKTKIPAGSSERPRTGDGDQNQNVEGSSSSASSTGMRSLMRGLSMKAGKGLENAFDFVEGK